MKTIKLITFKLMLLFLTTTLFVNCENDTALETQDEVLTVAKQAPFSSRLVYTTEIERNTIISSKLRGITQNRNNASFESDTNGFTVDPDVANYVEKSDGSGYSYTFAISRDGVVGSELENLVLSVNTDTQELSTVLIKYHYTATQLQELLQTGHVSTHSETTVTPIEGDFSNLLAESNTLPCTIQITTYHITPDTGETFLYGTNSQCQHEIDPDSGETECEVYNVMNILCPPGTSTGTTGTTTTTGNPNTSGDPSNNTSSGGTTTPSNPNSPNNNDDEIVTTPLTKQEFRELSDQLDEVFGEDNWETDENVPDDAPNFESIEELEVFLQNLLNENSVTESSEMELGQENTRRDVHSLHFSSFPQAKIVITVKLTPPAQGDHLAISDFKNIRTTLQGNNTYFDWTQFDSEDPSDSDGPSMEVRTNSTAIVAEVEGEMQVGFKFKGNPFKARDLITISIYYNYITAQIDSHYTHWFFTD
ncbi:hypothetical protein [Kordia sp.]|uniref:hypothetical protein n=1 Tax=Kordia sp. TaxID=1965332 RepID=UPI003D2CCC03